MHLVKNKNGIESFVSFKIMVLKETILTLLFSFYFIFFLCEKKLKFGKLGTEC